MCNFWENHVSWKRRNSGKSAILPFYFKQLCSRAYLCLPVLITVMLCLLAFQVIYKLEHMVQSSAYQGSPTRLGCDQILCPVLNQLDLASCQTMCYFLKQLCLLFKMFSLCLWLHSLPKETFTNFGVFYICLTVACYEPHQHPPPDLQYILKNVKKIPLRNFCWIPFLLRSYYNSKSSFQGHLRDLLSLAKHLYLHMDRCKMFLPKIDSCTTGSIVLLKHALAN